MKIMPARTPTSSWKTFISHCVRSLLATLERLAIHVIIAFLLFGTVSPILFILLWPTPPNPLPSSSTRTIKSKFQPYSCYPDDRSGLHFAHRWTIEHFADLVSDRPNSGGTEPWPGWSRHWFSSESFSPLNHSEQVTITLRIDPEGGGEDYRENVAFYLNVRTTPDDHSMSMSSIEYLLCIQNLNATNRHCVAQEMRPDNSHAIHDLIPRRQLLDRKQGFLDENGSVIFIIQGSIMTGQYERNEGDCVISESRFRARPDHTESFIHEWLIEPSRLTKLDEAGPSMRRRTSQTFGSGLRLWLAVNERHHLVLGLEHPVHDPLVAVFTVALLRSTADDQHETIIAEIGGPVRFTSAAASGWEMSAWTVSELVNPDPSVGYLNTEGKLRLRIQGKTFPPGMSLSDTELANLYLLFRNSKKKPIASVDITYDDEPNSDDLL